MTESIQELVSVGLSINLVTYYDDIGETYPWVVKLPVQAITLDFCGVPGSAVPCATLELIQKHGFPSDKRLDAGVIDGRSVWADTGVASAIVGNLVNKARASPHQDELCMHTVCLALDSSLVIETCTALC